MAVYVDGKPAFNAAVTALPEAQYGLPHGAVNTGFQLTWDSTRATNGTHTIQVVVRSNNAPDVLRTVLTRTIQVTN